MTCRGAGFSRGLEERLAHRALPALVCTLFACGVSIARADEPTKEQCVAANERAQDLRQQGKLRAARAELLVCLSKSCPGPVRDDCRDRLAAEERAAPTVIFDARSDAGQVLRDVVVTMDDARLTDHLGGAPLVVDPGEHLFRFEAEGYERITRRIAFTEGAKERREIVTLTPTVVDRASSHAPITAASGRADAATPPTSGAAKSDHPTTESSNFDRRSLAYALGAAGIVSLGVGIYFGLHAKSTYDDATSSANCPTGLSSCNQAGVDGDKSAHTQAAVSTVTMILGGALLAGGVVLFVTAPRDGAVNVQPTVGTSSAGIQLGGRW